MILNQYKRMKISNIKIIEDNEKFVICTGDKKTGSHPKIYLNLQGEDSSIECYYCGKTFIHKSKYKKK